MRALCRPGILLRALTWSAVLGSFAASWPAQADGMRVHRRLVVVRYHLPPERHVLEEWRELPQWPGMSDVMAVFRRVRSRGMAAPNGSVVAATEVA